MRQGDCMWHGASPPSPRCHQGVYARLRAAMERVGVRGRFHKAQNAGRTPRAPWERSALRVHPGAHSIDKLFGIALRQAVYPERIEAAAAFDGKRVPYKPSLMGYLGEVRHRQMLILPDPRRQPKLDLYKGDAELVGRQAVGEKELGEPPVAHRP